MILSSLSYGPEKSKKLQYGRLLVSAGVVLALALAAALTGCASMYSRSLSTASDFDTVFAACKSAVVECGFGVISSNATEGDLNARRYHRCGFEEPDLMTILVRRSGTGCTVRVSIALGDGIGSTREVLDKFFRVLRDRRASLRYPSGPYGMGTGLRLLDSPRKSNWCDPILLPS
jgi:hypothetical protein